MKSLAKYPERILLAVVAAGLLFAGVSPTTNSYRMPSSSELSAVALTDATAANRTVTYSLGSGGRGSWSQLRFGVQLTDADASTVNLTLTPTCSYDGTTYYQPTTRSCTAGTCTVSIQTETHAVSADGNIEVVYDVRGCSSFQIVVDDSSGATAVDTVTTQGVVITGN